MISQEQTKSNLKKFAILRFIILLWVALEGTTINQTFCAPTLRGRHLDYALVHPSVWEFFNFVTKIK